MSVTLRPPCLCPSEGHKHGISIQSSINLGDALLQITRGWKIVETWFLARLFIYQSSIVSKILDLIHWMVTILVLITWLVKTENYLEYGCHVVRLHRRRRCRRAYAPTSNTSAHDNHEKINSWVSFFLPYGYGAPLGGPLGRWSSAIICGKTLCMNRPFFVASYLQVTWWALDQWKGRKKMHQMIMIVVWNEWRKQIILTKVKKSNIPNNSQTLHCALTQSLLRMWFSCCDFKQGHLIGIGEF